LYQERRDLTARPLRDRRTRLEDVVANKDLVFPVRRLAPDGLEAWAQVVGSGHEGYVAKDEACPRVGGARSPKVARLVGTNGLRSYPWH
jgi:ATP-dependent DNA ligase